MRKSKVLIVFSRPTDIGEPEVMNKTRAENSTCLSPRDLISEMGRFTYRCDTNNRDSILRHYENFGSEDSVARFKLKREPNLYVQSFPVIRHVKTIF